MKTIITSICSTLLLIFAVSSASALEPLVLYDDFSGDRIDPDKWLANDILRPALDVRREVTRAERLRLLNRTYANTTFTGGRNDTRVRLSPRNSAAITAMQATVRLRSVEVTGCSVPTGTFTRIRARLFGGFFNDGTSPGFGDPAGDVAAQIYIDRRSDIPDPPGVMRVVANVFHCPPSNVDPGCLVGTDLFFDNQTLGTLMPTQRARLKVQWDQANKLFIFQRDQLPELIYSYASTGLADENPAVLGKRIEMRAQVENCAESPRPVASMDIAVDNVFVNESAVAF